jgi:hypothetical protein
VLGCDVKRMPNSMFPRLLITAQAARAQASSHRSEAEAKG